MKTLSIRREGIDFSFEENDGIVSINYYGQWTGLPPFHIDSKCSGSGEYKIPEGQTFEESCMDTVNEFFGRNKPLSHT